MKDIFGNFVALAVVGTGFLGLAAVLCAVHGLLVTALWNWLMPELFGLKTITWLQGWGLAFLSSLLFKNISGNSNGSK